MRSAASTYLIIFVLIFVGLAVVAYFRPVYKKWLPEGFATIAIESNTIPKCLYRSPEAQQVLQVMYPLVQNLPPASPQTMAYNEFKTIMEKIQCIDADITGLGGGPFSTYQLPFETQQDIEPAASFVGRCLRNGVNERDIEVQYAKYIDRGIVLINTIVKNPAINARIQDQFVNVAQKSAKAISFICLSGNAGLQNPAGPRDPGYYTPPSLQEFGKYTIRGAFQYF